MKSSYFAYASTNSTITYLIGIYLFPSINASSNAKKNTQKHIVDFSSV